YFVLPLKGTHNVSDAALLGICLVVFVLVSAKQVHGVLHSPYPVIRAIQSLALLIPVFIVTFAGYYYVSEQHNPQSFSSMLSRTDSLYFTVTVLSTVGFGDIVARSEAARIAVTVQMI